MSEFCILGDNDGFKGNGRDLGMETALFVANVIHADLTIANASAWQWWLAVSPYDFKDGLVYIDKSKTDGTIYESKLEKIFSIRKAFEELDINIKKN